MSDDASCRDDRVVADRHPLEHHRPVAQPDALLKDYGLARRVPRLVLDTMKVTVHDHDVRADQAIVSDLDVGARDERAAVIDKHVVADLKVAAREGDELEGGDGGDQANVGPRL